MDTHTRIITELSAVERDMDLVLFRRYDDDDDGIGLAGIAGIGAVGTGAGLGAYGLVKKGQRLNQTQSNPGAGNLTLAQVGAESSAGGGVQISERGRRIMPERRFTLNPGPPVTVPSTKGVFGDFATGAKAFGKTLSGAGGDVSRAAQGKLGLSSLYKRVIARGAKFAR